MAWCRQNVAALKYCGVKLLRRLARWGGRCLAESLGLIWAIWRWGLWGCPAVDGELERLVGLALRPLDDGFEVVGEQTQPGGGFACYGVALLPQGLVVSRQHPEDVAATGRNLTFVLQIR